MSSRLHFWVGISLLFLILIIALTNFFVLKFFPATLPLFYSLPWGQAQLATHTQFLIIPASISAITILNLIISWQLHQSQSFFKKILLLSSIVVSLIFTITFVKIILNLI